MTGNERSFSVHTHMIRHAARDCRKYVFHLWATRAHLEKIRVHSSVVRLGAHRWQSCIKFIHQEEDLVSKTIRL